ncbi:MAG: hypothetical protein ABW154_07705 [Dyella sp.]
MCQSVTAAWNARPRRWPLGLLSSLLLLVAPVHAAVQIIDFSGAWQRDDSASDDDSAIEALLRDEATRELSPQTTPAVASSSAAPPIARGGGHGGGRGGMGGGGHAGGKHAKSGDSSNGKTPDVPASYPLPPQLDNDSLLLVQQDATTVQVRLDSGELLNGRLDGHARQSLNGSAMVSTFAEAGGLNVVIEYADGSRLQQHWARAVDGHRVTVYERWKVPQLQQAISFKRSYIAIN